MELKGAQFGIRLEPRDSSSGDTHVCIQLLSEDDDNWFEVGNAFSSFWLGDLIGVLQGAKQLLENPNQFEKEPWGYRFK